MGYYEKKPIYAVATDPIYIGTGGYTIGRVDNTIVRDPATKIPKIPGSSLAGTWRYYVALGLNSKIKDYQPDFEEIKKEKEKTLEEKLNKYNWKNLNGDKREDDFKKLNNWMKFNGNQIAKITCAGQDNVPASSTDSPDEKDKYGNTGHCGHCIVCKAFGYSKKDKSWQGMLFFSDLNILFFPVYTRLGVKWISSKRILREAGVINQSQQDDNQIVFAQGKIEDDKSEGNINLGWLNLPYKVDTLLNIDSNKIKFDNFELKPEDVIIVPDSLISQIINSNLEVRTSVSIDPITGTAKEKALFTSEAIPRGTVFYGKIRIFDKSGFPNIGDLPGANLIWQALEDTKSYYEVFGIGGMTTRGFGRMKILTDLSPEDKKQAEGKDSDKKGGEKNGA